MLQPLLRKKPKSYRRKQNKKRGKKGSSKVRNEKVWLI